MTSLNWNPSKGNPYYYEIPSVGFRYRRPTFIITKPKHIYKIGVKGTMDCAIHLKTAASLTLKQSLILSTDKGLFLPKTIKKNPEINVIIDYPFTSAVVEASIYPLTLDKMPPSRSWLDWVGYYIWCIAKVYAQVYKHHWQEVGVYGHGFDDLVLEGIRYTDHTFKLQVGS